GPPAPPRTCPPGEPGRPPDPDTVAAPPAAAHNHAGNPNNLLNTISMLSRSARPHRSPRPITAPEFWNSPSPGAGGRCAFRAGPAFEFTARRGATTVPGIRHAVFATRQPRNRRGPSAVRFSVVEDAEAIDPYGVIRLRRCGGKNPRPGGGGGGGGG